jgi:hypothetical protein
MTRPELRYTLVADGPTDRALMRITAWLLRQIEDLVPCAFVPQFFDPRVLDDPPEGLAAKIERALSLFPCNILFVHRDAEASAPSDRVLEIERALPTGVGSHVCIVPVRMTEAWLLIDERAIRMAAGNPHGVHSLGMPSAHNLESLANPKHVLRDLLVQASAFCGRRRDKFERELSQRVHRVAELIDDFGTLRSLPAFREFEQDTRSAVLAWTGALG